MLLSRGRWRQWRRGRPFWGGLAAIVAGAEICAIPLAPLKVMLHQGIAGIPSVLMGAVMILMGLAAWFAPQYRSLAGIVTVMVAAAALVMSNLGGFLVGTLIGIVGGGLIFAWQPLPSTDVQPGAPPDASPHTPPDAPQDASPPGAAPPDDTQPLDVPPATDAGPASLRKL
ncbi:DUF6114 domain-containing protein [Streptomyces sp. NPDC057654]|uniref:DUF6114 domain-containing protein n=1 Tax=Streptomyces sp. NPDC057654 TaxID=3346196 RepID=UPI00367A670E